MSSEYMNTPEKIAQEWESKCRKLEKENQRLRQRVSEMEMLLDRDVHTTDYGNGNA